MSSIKLIVGLGNPGKEYQNTRHNAGEDFVRELASANFTELKKEGRFFGLTTTVTINNRSVRLLVPDTYMNKSGKSVAAISNFYRVAVDEILVVHDELDLKPGIARLKQGGGHGGHNGLRDIISSLGNNRDFMRLRIGIGHPGNARQVSAYVLSKAPAEEQDLVSQSIKQAMNAIPELVAGNHDKAIRDLHSINPASGD